MLERRRKKKCRSCGHRHPSPENNVAAILAGVPEFFAAAALQELAPAAGRSSEHRGPECLRAHRPKNRPDGPANPAGAAPAFGTTSSGGKAKSKAWKPTSLATAVDNRRSFRKP